MFCSHCGKTIPADAAFCPKCGGRSSTSEKSEAPSERSPAHSIKLSKHFLVVLGGLMGALLFFIALPGGGSGIPECASSDARESLGQVIEEGMPLNFIKLQLLDLKNIRQVAYEAEQDRRTCEGDALLNTGQTHLFYRFYPTSDQTQVIVEFRESPFNPW